MEVFVLIDEPKIDQPGDRFRPCGQSAQCLVLFLLITYQVYVGNDSFPIMQFGGMPVRSLSCLCWEAWKTQQGQHDAYAPDGKPRPESRPWDEMDSRYCSRFPRMSTTFVLSKAWFSSFRIWFLFPPNKQFHLIQNTTARSIFVVIFSNSIIL